MSFAVTINTAAGRQHLTVIGNLDAFIAGLPDDEPFTFTAMVRA